MGKRLRLEFADRKLCAHCGAPAARLGHEYTTALGEVVFDPTPLVSEYITTPTRQRRVESSDRGSIIARTINRGRGGFSDDDTVIYGLRYTHLCTRDQTCGVLTQSALLDADQLPGECYVGSDAPST